MSFTYPNSSNLGLFCSELRLQDNRPSIRRVSSFQRWLSKSQDYSKRQQSMNSDLAVHTSSIRLRSLVCRVNTSSRTDETCDAEGFDGDFSMVLLPEEDRYYYRQVDTAGLGDLAGAAPGDFFELLGVDLQAEKQEIKESFRTLQRLVHPDIVGESAHDLAVMLNSAYSTLINDNSRSHYADDVRKFRQETGGSFHGVPVSKWNGKQGESRAIFVDESVCIGCMSCTFCAPNTFFMEDEYGRARVNTQWGDEEDAVREAVDICPVDCISYVQRSQLALLEFVMKGVRREDIAIMARRRSGNMGPSASSENPFTRAAVFLKHRKEAQVYATADGDGKRVATHNEMLSAAIAKAWLQLPEEVRLKGWPSWFDGHEGGGDGVYGWKRQDLKYSFKY